MKIARVALAVPALALIAACGTNSVMSDSAPTAADQPSSESGAGGDGVGVGAPTLPGTADKYALSSTPDAPQPADARAQTEAQTKAVISTGQVDLHSDDIDAARFELKKLLDTWGGSIANEESDADDEGNTRRARLELRIPSSHFDDAMDALPGLGSLVNRSRTSQDVTTQIIDNNARVRSQKLSLARVQALLAKAKDINQVIAIEEQLSQRQADLDSLEQQQKYLADQTSQSTISLYLSKADKAESGTKDDDHKTFASGLRSGWDHLGTATRNVLNVVGAALPFGAVLAALLIAAQLSRRLLRGRGRSAA